MKIQSMSRGLILPVLAALGIGTTACDTATGDLLGPNEGSAVVTGVVESEGAASASSAPTTSASPAQSSEAQARTVVIGEVQSGGGFQALAEAEVDVEGRYRIEEVPAPRADLVIRAKNDAGVEIASVVLQGEIRAGAEHRARPMNARSTLHARAWTRTRTSGQGHQGMGAAELALFLHTSNAVALQSANSTAQLDALVTATVQAQQAITAVLESEGHAMSAQARNALLVALAAQRDEALHGGAGVEVTQRSYVSAALDAFAEEGVSFEALALAYASATTALDHAMAQANATARLDVAKAAVLLNIESRRRVAAAAEGGALGVRGAVMATLDEMEARVRVAGSVQELKASMEEERGKIEDRVVLVVLGQVVGLGLEQTTEIETHLRSALAQARLWVHMENSVDATAFAQAAAEFRSEVEAVVDAFVATLPSSAQASVSTELMVRLLVGLGAGGHVA